MNIYTVVCKAKGTLTLHASTEFQACKTAQSIWNMDATTRYGTPVGIRAYYVGPAELHDAHVRAYYKHKGVTYA